MSFVRRRSVSRLCETKQKLSMKLSLHGNTKTARKVRGFDNKHFLILRVRRHLVTQFSVSNDEKQNSKVRRRICGSFIELTPILTCQMIKTPAALSRQPYGTKFPCVERDLGDFCSNRVLRMESSDFLMMT
jgi:hypothetical protein